ncbi:uncharacterized protein DFL_004212 [Arthrobotrys flagrans]|uniref:Uncharacterized protein n=1 Tax=Arthrobotrys flagrans TaxID=97331 RepID=A0A437A489_ARTFL|nr:hypothetical protein DFL_004212 [Arthrobotrys flagrans]
MAQNNEARRQEIWFLPTPSAGPVLVMPRPTAIRDPTAGGWQRAIDGIPRIIRDHNRNWRWNHFVETVGFPEIDFPVGFSDGPSSSVAAPGGEQPLPLSGPDEPQIDPEIANEFGDALGYFLNNLSPGSSSNFGGRWGDGSSGSGTGGGGVSGFGGRGVKAAPELAVPEVPETGKLGRAVTLNRSIPFNSSNLKRLQPPFDLAASVTKSPQGPFKRFNNF